jgi:protein tyrosine/serine phosphatase
VRRPGNKLVNRWRGVEGRSGSGGDEAVHCAGGRRRTGVMTAVYRMTHDGWSPDQANKEMKQYKFGADFLHPEFRRFVSSYRVEPQDRALDAALATN